MNSGDTDLLKFTPVGVYCNRPAKNGEGGLAAALELEIIR
jgi:hypothetical protein